MKGRIRHTFGLDDQHLVRGILGIRPGITTKDPFVNVLLSPWSESGHDRLERESVTKAVPLGEMFDLFAGAVIDDNSVVGTAFLSPFVLDLVFDDSAKIVTRDAIGGDGLVPQLNHPLAFSELAKTQYLEVGREDGSKVYIATAEIFRFYYMSSTRLGLAILGGDIMEPTKKLYVPKHSHHRPDGTSRIVYRRGMLKSDARAIAILAFSPVALKHAQDAHVASMRSPKQGSKAIAARPPFIGKTSLKCEGIRLGSQEDAPILVTRIRSCSGPIPFRDLERMSERHFYAPSGGKDKPAGEKKRKKKRRMAVDPKKLDFVYLDKGEAPSTQFIPQTIAMDDLASRFTAFENTALIDVRQEGKDGPERKEKKERPVEQASLNNSMQAATGKGAGTGSQRVEMTSGDDAEEDDNSGDGNDSGPSPLEVLEYTLEVLNEIVDLSGASAADRVISENGGTMLDHHFNLFPNNVGGVRKKWLYFDDERETRLRPLLIVELCSNDRYGYLADIVHQPGEQMSLMVFKAVDGDRLIDQQLIDLIIATAEARVEKKETPVELMKEYGIDLRHEDHRRKGTPRGRAEMYCEFLCLV